MRKTKKYWIVVRNRREIPGPPSHRFARHASLAEAIAEAHRLCVALPEYPPSRFRIFECVGEVLVKRDGQLSLREAADG